jgi:hypothetical protein
LQRGLDGVVEPGFETNTVVVIAKVREWLVGARNVRRLSVHLYLQVQRNAALAIDQRYLESTTDLHAAFRPESLAHAGSHGLGGGTKYPGGFIVATQLVSSPCAVR